MEDRKSIFWSIAFTLAILVAQPSDAQPASAVPAAVATPAVVPLTASPTAAGAKSEYVLGAEDVIEIEVVGQPDRARAHIYTDGTIQMNLIGKLMAAGKTSPELGKEISEALKAGGYFSNPVVHIEVVSFASRYVTVLGAVGAAGLVPINRPYRMSEILARVGGVQAAAADYLIVRPETGPEKRYFIEKLAIGDSTEDPFVTPGDKIYVPIADVFYISGQVNSPGNYPLKTGMTLREAIAKAGGLGASGTDRGVRINRGGKKMKLDVSGKIEAGDVITVPERLF